MENLTSSYKDNCCYKFSFTDLNSVKTKNWVFTVKITIDFLIVRGRRTTMCEAPDVKLSGAFGVTCHSHLCHQR